VLISFQSKEAGEFIVIRYSAKLTLYSALQAVLGCKAGNRHRVLGWKTVNRFHEIQDFSSPSDFAREENEQVR
jgi:hypothetical protein